MAWYENIKRLREENNLTQQQLADRLYVSRQTVCRWESGSRCPDLDMARNLAKEFGISLDELLSEEDAERPAGERGFFYPAKIIAGEKLREKRKRIMELMEIAAGIFWGMFILLSGVEDVQIPLWGRCLQVGVVVVLYGSYIKISRKIQKT